MNKKPFNYKLETKFAKTQIKRLDIKMKLF